MKEISLQIKYDSKIDKFDDIKAGDTVITRFSTGGFDPKSFWKTESVDSATPKRFKVNGDVFAKGNGKMLGRSHFVRAYMATKGRMAIVRADSVAHQAFLYGQALESKACHATDRNRWWEKCTNDQLERILAIMDEGKEGGCHERDL